MKKSTPIIKEIKDHCKKKGYHAERINAGKIPVGKGWMVLATEGHPDMVLYLPGPFILFIEIKAPGDSLSEAQKEYISDLERSGFEVLIAEDSAIVLSWLQSHGF